MSRTFLQTVRRFPGMSAKSLRNHMGLVPLLGAFIGGAVLSSVYLARLATRCPDVCWDKNKPYPWQRVAHNHQYKFYSSFDYNKLEKPAGRPEI